MAGQQKWVQMALIGGQSAVVPAPVVGHQRVRERRQQVAQATESAADEAAASWLKNCLQRHPARFATHTAAAAAAAAEQRDPAVVQPTVMGAGAQQA